MEAKGGQSAAAPGLFTRKATGLVREVGGSDALIMNLMWVNIVLGVLLFTLAPMIFPGVNMALGFLLTTVILIVPILLYAWLAAAMPRSGGEYVYISRILHPALGFVCNFVFSVSLILFIAVFSTFVTSTGLTPMFATLGTITGNDSLISLSQHLGEDKWVFVIGLATIIACCAANWFGMKVLMIFQRIMFGFSLLSLAIAGVLMAITSRADFEARFDKFGDFQHVISTAGHEGFQIGAHNSIGGLIAFTALGFTVLALAQMPAYAAGELRRPQRNAVFSMIGALILAGVIFAVLAALAQHTFGLDFLGGMTFLSENGSAAYPSSLPAPFFLLYTSMLTSSTPLIAIMTFGVITALLGNIAVTMVVPSRNLLAWSVDGVLPGWVRRTHPKYNSPTAAILLVGAFSTAVLIPLVFGPPNLFNFVFSAATMQALVFLFTAIAGTLFAFRLPVVFASSPYNRRWGQVPIMSVIGGVSFLLYAYFAYKLITDDRIGANSTSGLIAIGVGIVLGIAIYAASWSINREKGIDLGATYRELPPE